MKKLLTAILLISMFFTLLVPMSHAQEQEDRYVPEETYTREELLAMDPELDSDGDGLSDVIELVYGFNRYDADTDGDGVTDYTEFCITCTDVLVPDGQIDTDGDGLTNAEEAVYGTNPDDLDTDNDNLGDYEEIMVLHTDPLVKNATQQGTDSQFPDSLESGEITLPGNQPNAFDGPVIDDGGLGGMDVVYSGTLYTKYDNTVYTSSVSYKMDFDLFFESNTTYRKDLAVVSSLLSAIAYKDNYLNVTGGGLFTSTAATAVWDWMNYHGFSHPTDSYDLNDDFLDQHVSEMYVGHRTITYNGTSKKLICVVIRGTNRTLNEWRSNFDIGSTDNFNAVSGWTNPNNHMGFDITSNRLNDKLSAYMNANGLTSSNSILWITGHSRGGALANLLAAKRCAAGQKVFAYTFASPNTTDNESANAAIYNGIFNIINTDDFVTKLPLTQWEFTRYGTYVPESIETTGNYANQWDTLTGLEYVHAETAQNNALTKFATIASNRNQCYVYPGIATGFVHYSEETYASVSMAETAAASFVMQYPSVTSGMYKTYVDGIVLSYGYTVEYKPAILMMLMADVMPNLDLINGMAFAVCDLPLPLDASRDAVLSYALNHLGAAIKYPHYVESYYILVQNIS